MYYFKYVYIFKRLENSKEVWKEKVVKFRYIINYKL